MAHGNTVADSNGRENDRGTACHGNAKLNGFRDLIQVHVPRNDLVIRTDNTDERTGSLFHRQAQCMVKGSVRRVVETIHNSIFDHDYSSIKCLPL